MRFLMLLAIVFAASLVAGDSALAQATADEAYARGRQCYSDLKADPKISAQKAEWEKCADIFEKVNMAFPGDKDGTNALFSAARLRREMYYKFRNPADVEASISLYNKVVKQYPKSTLADDSLYNIAVLRHRPLGQDERAQKALEFLLANYPDGDMAGKAKSLKASLSVPSSAAVAAAETTAGASGAAVAEEDVSATAGDGKLEVIEIHEGGAQGFGSDVAGPFDGAVLTKVDVKNSDGGTRVDLDFTRAVAYAVEFTETGARTRSPPVLELTLSYTEPADALPRDFRVGSEHLEGIKIKKRILGSGSRVVFKMKHGTTYDVIPTKETLSVTFRKGGTPSARPSLATASDAPSAALAADSKKKAAHSDRPGARGEGPGGDRTGRDEGEGRGPGDIEEAGEGAPGEDGGEGLPD